MVPKGLIIIFLFIGAIFMIYQIAINNKCKKDKEVIIRYIPKTLEEEFKYGHSATDVFKTLISQPSPWIKLIGNHDRKKHEDTKNYFISNEKSQDYFISDF